MFEEKEEFLKVCSRRPKIPQCYTLTKSTKGWKTFCEKSPEYIQNPEQISGQGLVPLVRGCKCVLTSNPKHHANNSDRTSGQGLVPLVRTTMQIFTFVIKSRRCKFQWTPSIFCPTLNLKSHVTLLD